MLGGHSDTMIPIYLSLGQALGVPEAGMDTELS